MSKSSSKARLEARPQVKVERKDEHEGDRKQRVPRTTTAERNEDWAEVANFVVTFERRGSQAEGTLERRITAHKMQDGGISARWSGPAQQPMVAWMAQQVGEWAADVASTEGTTPAAPNGPGPAATTDACAVSIQDFQALALGESKAFDLEANIEVQGLETVVQPGALALPPCTVAFYSRNVATRDKSALGSVVLEDLEPGRRSYRARLKAVVLPAGEYRLESVALLRGRSPKMAHKVGPVLHVR
jgi:hypothetical protein